MPLLDDNDMHAILTCIDAKHTLKKLKLAGDVHELMVDAFVQPLAGSSVLELIDQNRWYDEKDVKRASRIVLICQVPVPILDSILLHRMAVR